MCDLYLLLLLGLFGIWFVCVLVVIVWFVVLWWCYKLDFWFCCFWWFGFVYCCLLIIVFDVCLVLVFLFLVVEYDFGGIDCGGFCDCCLFRLFKYFVCLIVLFMLCFVVLAMIVVFELCLLFWSAFVLRFDCVLVVRIGGFVFADLLIFWVVECRFSCVVFSLCLIGFVVWSIVCFVGWIVVGLGCLDVCVLIIVPAWLDLCFVVCVW